MAMETRHKNKRSNKTFDDEIVCDICWFPTTNKMPHLVECKVCHVVVHPSCYEINLPTPEQRESFTCWACQAVDTTVKFRERDVLTGDRFRCRITRRPTACALCQASDAEHAHAMHPLFDDYGPRARQIRLQNNQPAWVHTLCALILARQSGGLVSIRGVNSNDRCCAAVACVCVCKRERRESNARITFFLTSGRNTC